MTTNLNDYKERAKRLKKGLLTIFNIDSTLSQAYELMAKEENYPNWDSLSGSIHKTKIELEDENLSIKDQITQLFLFYQSIKNGLSIHSTLDILKEQKNSVISKRWSNVTPLLLTGKDFFEIFEQTKFFNDEVLTILKITYKHGNLDSGLLSAIEFLKMQEK